MNLGRSLQDGNSVLGEKKDQVAAVFLFSGCNTIGAGTLGLAYIGTLCGSWAVGVHEIDHYTYDAGPVRAVGDLKRDLRTMNLIVGRAERTWVVVHAVQWVQAGCWDQCGIQMASAAIQTESISSK